MSMHGTRIYFMYLNDCEDGSDWCIYLSTEPLAIQPHILNQVSCVYVARQCEAGLKLVCTLVDRASSYPASHSEPRLLCVRS